MDNPVHQRLIFLGFALVMLWPFFLLGWWVGSR